MLSPCGLDPIYYLRDLKRKFMKTLRWVAIILLGLLILGYFFGIPYMREQTKKNSPEMTALYQQDGLDLEVHYCSPSKKNREILGALVPYGEVWRTGANEPTTFQTATDIEIGGQKLNKGLYSVWTIPGPEQWTVIFNRDVPDWGVTLSSLGRKTTRNPESDVIQVVVPADRTQEIRENFQIQFISPQGRLYLQMAWDNIQVSTPINQ